MSLPVLEYEQDIDGLLREAEGRAVSFQDSPSWFMGIRKSTVVSRDGFGYVGYMKGGSMASLAYSLRDHCTEYLRLRESIQRCYRTIAYLQGEISIEEKRKRPSKRRMADLTRDLSIQYQDIRNCETRMKEMVAKYFRGFEERLLIRDL